MVTYFFRHKTDIIPFTTFFEHTGSVHELGILTSIYYIEVNMQAKSPYHINYRGNFVVIQTMNWWDAIESEIISSQILPQGIIFISLSKEQPIWFMEMIFDESIILYDNILNSSVYVGSSKMSTNSNYDGTNLPSTKVAWLWGKMLCLVEPPIPICHWHFTLSQLVCTKAPSGSSLY